MFGGIGIFHTAVPYFCIAVNVIVNLVIVLLQSMTCRILSLQQEKDAPDTSEERSSEYNFSREMWIDQPEMPRSEAADPGFRSWFRERKKIGFSRDRRSSSFMMPM